MARGDQGRDRAERPKSTKRGRGKNAKQVHIFAEGEVTEIQYIDLIIKRGKWLDPAKTVDHHFENDTAPSKLRKPLRMVREAVTLLRDVERQAENEGLAKNDWNWPEVWVLYDRDDHPGIPEARDLAGRNGVRIAYSHPCFELWRLLHYENYTSTFGGVCGDANGKLRQQPGFAQTYGRNVRRISADQSKQVKSGQILSTEEDDRYNTAKRYAQKINNGRSGSNPNGWDPYTDVFDFVEQGLLLSGY